MAPLERLEALLESLGRTALGYSGGVDSAVLAVVGSRVIGPAGFLAIIGRSASYPASQYLGAVALARAHAVPLLEIETGELDDPDYQANRPDRCFHCKRELWNRLGAVARDRGFDTVIDGTHADDLAEHRPGRAAGTAAGVRSPLAELGLSKQEVRSMARSLDLPVWDAPASPCLASRIQYGLGVTHQRLSQVEQAESALRGLGVGGNLRVRHRGGIATVEVDPEWIDWVETRWDLVEPMLRAQGFERASLDPRGYRRGRLVSELPVRAG